MLEAVNAARERKTSVVTQLIASGAANARDIAVAASSEFGVPLFDLDAVNIDLDSVRLVSDKLLAKHRVLPLFRRGKRLFLAVADPTNLHAIDEVKFQTSLGIEAIVVEDDKLQKAIDKALEQVDNQMSGAHRRGGRRSRVSRGHGRRRRARRQDRARRRRRRADRALRQQGDARCHPARRLRHPLRAVREDLPRALPHGRRAEGDRPAAGAARTEALGAPQGHVAPRHRRAARAAGRPHQDEAVQEPRHRLPRQHLPDAVRREDRAAYPRSRAGDARHRRARLRALPEGSLHQVSWPSPRA